MTRKMIILGTAILLAAAMFSGPSLSQTRRTTPRLSSEEVHRRHLEWATKRREKFKQMREQAIAEAMKQARRQTTEQSFREALKASDAQWPIILPKLMKVDDLQEEIKVAVRIKDAQWVTTTETLRGNRGASNAGTSNTPVTNTTRHYEDWRYTKSWERETELTKAQKACDELVALFDSGEATDEQKREKMNALRQIRREAAEELTAAQQELRKALSLRQEATLVMMGLLN
ncbi:MAG: hypothetical protein U9Q07_04695 [Planctomycetota bacterium]|nr:hypothetical protein [Planctomycetota bacterium]